MDLLLVVHLRIDNAAKQDINKILPIVYSITVEGAELILHLFIIIEDI